MLAYAANTPRTAGRTGSPKALTLIIAGHAVLIAAVMTARMDVTRVTPARPPKLIDIFTPPPPPAEPEPQVQAQPHTVPVPQPPLIDRQPQVVDMGRTDATQVEVGPIFQPLPPLGGTGGVVAEPPKHEPVKIAAIPRTPDSALRPPYPNDKLRLEQEATLKLRLTIDTRGRVIAVDPVGRSDPSFLEAARRHIIRAWRYKPATEDGVAVPSTMVINLSFRLEEA